MTVAEMIEWLKTHPQEARVFVVERNEYDYGGNHEPFDPSNSYQWHILDFKEKTYSGDLNGVCLFLGEA